MAKQVIFVACTVLVLAIGFVAGRYSSPSSNPRILSKPVVTSTLPARPAAAAPVLSPTLEWQKIRSIRDITLQKNPELAAEYQTLVAGMKAQQDQLDEAMIKADPKVAPIVAKLRDMRKETHLAHEAIETN